MKRTMCLLCVTFLFFSFLPYIEAEKEKVNIKLEQTYDIDPSRNEVKMTFKVAMENTDVLDKESYKEWEWEFGFSLSDIKVRDGSGELKYDYDKKDASVNVKFKKEISYGEKYEYTIEAKMPLNGLQSVYCYEKLESLMTIYIPFEKYPTHLTITFPKDNYVELPFKAVIKESGNLVTAEADVSGMEYTVLFMEMRKFEKVSKKVRLQKREFEIIGAGINRKWAEDMTAMNVKLFPFLESAIGLPFPDNIDRFILYQVKESENNNCWGGFHWGTNIVTFYKDEKAIVELLAHELSHHWFTQDEQWINEGNAELYSYLALKKFGYNSEAEDNMTGAKREAARLQNVPLSTASYDKYRQAVYYSGFLFSYDLYQKYGQSGMQKLNKSIVPENVNSFEFYYYATKTFGEGVSEMFERRIFPKEDMPKINEFKKSYEEYLKTYNYITGLHEKNGVSTKTWRDKKDDIRKKVDKMDFDATKITEEISAAKDAETALKKYEDFISAMKEKGITPTDEQTGELTKKLADRDYSTIDQEIEKLRNALTPTTTPPQTTQPPPSTTLPPTEAPPEKTGFGIFSVAVALAVLVLKKRN